MVAVGEDTFPGSWNYWAPLRALGKSFTESIVE